VTELEFFDEPAAFLRAAGPLLRGEPVRSTVIAGVTARMAGAPDQGRPAGAPAPWWVVVREGAAVVGAAMRTAPFFPHPPYLLALPEEGARALARALHARGERIDVVNGFVPTIDVFAAETVTLTGGRVEETERTTLYELTELVEPAAVPGRARQAREEEVDLVQGWFDLFGPDASEQAGRVDPHPQIESRESTLRRIRAGQVWVWESEEGVPLQVTGFHPASYGVARIGPVYTPKEHRGHGYAAAMVATLSRRVLADGARVCLFADEQNRTSTGVYVRLGYRAVAGTGGVALVGRD
jgi:GNAT superfamily N-acetyltransferase